MPMTKTHSEPEKDASTAASAMDARIERSLREAFAPERLDVVNESHLHTGHAGHDRSGASHYRVRVRAEAFRGQSRVAIHRAVNAALADELRTVHALAIDAKAPDGSDI